MRKEGRGIKEEGGGGVRWRHHIYTLSLSSTHDNVRSSLSSCPFSFFLLLFVFSLLLPLPPLLLTLRCTPHTNQRTSSTRPTSAVTTTIHEYVSPTQIVPERKYIIKIQVHSVKLLVLCVKLFISQCKYFATLNLYK